MWQWLEYGSFIELSLNFKTKARGLLFLATILFNLRFALHCGNSIMRMETVQLYKWYSNANCCKTEDMATTENVEASSTEAETVTIELKDG